MKSSPIASELAGRVPAVIMGGRWGGGGGTNHSEARDMSNKINETSNYKHSLYESWWCIGFEGNSAAKSKETRD